MFVGELESLDESQCFVDRPSNRKIVHRHLTQVAFIIDDEEAPAMDIYRKKCRVVLS